MQAKGKDSVRKGNNTVTNSPVKRKRVTSGKKRGCSSIIPANKLEFLESKVDDYLNRGGRTLLVLSMEG